MRKKSKVNIRSIAVIAGVSPSTVSRVLNNRGGISESCRTKIVKIAEECGYKQCSSTRTIALALPISTFPLDWYSVNVINAFRLECFKRNYKLEIVSADELDIISDSVVCGVVSFDFVGKVGYKWGRERKLPMVCMNSVSRHLDRVYSVYSNDFQGISQAVNHLVGYGHKRIGLLLIGNPEEHAAKLRTNAFLSINKEHHLEGYAYVANAYFHDGPNGFVDGLHGAVNELLKEKVTAMIISGENYALQTLHVLRDLNISVPKQMSLISWEMLKISEFASPPLTTIEQNFSELARQSINVLERLISGEKISKDTLVDYLFHYRNSVSIPFESNTISL